MADDELQQLLARLSEDEAIFLASEDATKQAAVLSVHPTSSYRDVLTRSRFGEWPKLLHGIQVCLNLRPW